MQMQKLDGTVLADNDWSLIKDDNPYPYALMYLFILKNAG
jgi:hypothetical protein